MLGVSSIIRDDTTWCTMVTMPTIASPDCALAPSPPQTVAQWVRVLGNAVNLSTPLGLVVAGLGRARLRPGPRGLVLGEGYRLPFPLAGAFTVGNVIITPSTFAALLQRHPELLTHEEQHSCQYLCCLGLPFLIAYPVAMGWSMVRTGNQAAGNVFEIQAGLESGGYHRYPTRPVSVGVRDLAGRLKQVLRKRTA